MALYIQHKYAKSSWGEGLEAYLSRAVEENRYISFKDMASVADDELLKKDSKFVEVFYPQAFSVVNFL